jgi:membrane peptidoglycan carboxypeptidase
MEMMRYTTTMGTSRREFMRGGQPTLGNIEVAGKTGTLSGTNPPGLNNWFVGAAPINNPELAVAVITVDASHSSKASHLARLVMQRYFNIEAGPELPEPVGRIGGKSHVKHSGSKRNPQQYWARKFKVSAKKGKSSPQAGRKSSKKA